MRHRVAEPLHCPFGREAYYELKQLHIRGIGGRLHRRPADTFPPLIAGGYASSREYVARGGDEHVADQPRLSIVIRALSISIAINDVSSNLPRLLDGVHAAISITEPDVSAPRSPVRGAPRGQRIRAERLVNGEHAKECEITLRSVQIWARQALIIVRRRHDRTPKKTTSPDHAVAAACASRTTGAAEGEGEGSRRMHRRSGASPPSAWDPLGVAERSRCASKWGDER